MSGLTRREFGAWTTPVVLAAVAAPAAAGSVPPPPVCVDPAGLAIFEAPGMPWKTNEGQGFTLVKGDAILVGNIGPFAEITVPVTLWSSADQDGITLITSSGDTLLVAPKDGNRASVDIVVKQGERRVLQITTQHKDAEAHLIIGCDRGFILKSAR